MNDGPKQLSNLSADAKRALLAKLLREKVQTQETWAPISQNQKALWFLSRLAPNSAAYNLLYAARISSRINRQALNTALQKLAQRYPTLSATYALHDGVPAQNLLRVAHCQLKSLTRPPGRLIRSSKNCCERVISQFH